jgi:hypothetical protein
MQLKDLCEQIAIFQISLYILRCVCPVTRAVSRVEDWRGHEMSGILLLEGFKVASSFPHEESGRRISFGVSPDQIHAPGRIGELTQIARPAPIEITQKQQSPTIVEQNPPRKMNRGNVTQLAQDKNFRSQDPNREKCQIQYEAAKPITPHGREGAEMVLQWHSHQLVRRVVVSSISWCRLASFFHFIESGGQRESCDWH